MPRQSNGNYLAPANTAAISGQPISSTAFNTLETDIGTEITNSVDRLGRSSMQANLPMGGNIITGHGTPSASTDVPNKAYVDAVVAAFFSTGDFKPTLKTTPDAGWLMCDDGTFGGVSSGSSNSNSASNLALFTLLFNNLSDSAAPLLTSGGGATTRAGQTNAATAWAANCRMTLPKMLGRVLGASGAGTGLTSRALGAALGEETHLLTLGETPTGITATGSGSASVTLGGGLLVPAIASGGWQNVGINTGASTAVGVQFINGSQSVQNISTISGTATSISTTSNNTGGGVHNNMQPTTFINWMIKQ